MILKGGPSAVSKPDFCCRIISGSADKSCARSKETFNASRKVWLTRRHTLCLVDLPTLDDCCDLLVRKPLNDVRHRKSSSKPRRRTYPKANRYNSENPSSGLGLCEKEWPGVVQDGWGTRRFASIDCNAARSLSDLTGRESRCRLVTNAQPGVVTFPRGSVNPGGTEGYRPCAFYFHLSLRSRLEAEHDFTGALE